MTDLSNQRRLAAEILGVGVSRIWIDPERIEDVAEAITREEIRGFIHDGVIKVLPVKSNSRGRWRVLHQKRKAGRRRGMGSRKGGKKARAPKKELWMGRIRKMRRYLKWLRDHGKIDTRTYRKYYRMAKGGMFKSLSSLRSHLEQELRQRR